MSAAACPNCSVMFHYERSTYLLALPYLRFCSKKCLDEFMEDKTVIDGFVPIPKDEDMKQAWERALREQHAALRQEMLREQRQWSDQRCNCILGGLGRVPPSDCPVHGLATI